MLMLAVMGVMAMAASPRLHEWAHPDANHENHECAVTLFATGSAADQVAPPPMPTGGDLPLVGILRMEVAREIFLARVEGRIRERAPPVSAA